MRRLFCLLLCLSSLALAAAAQSVLKGDLPAGANGYQKDFAAMARYILKTNAGLAPPLKRLDAAEYQGLAENTWNMLGEAKDGVDWYLDVSWFLEKLGDGHTALEPAYDTALPISVAWFGDELWGIKATDASAESLVGRKLTSLGGRPIAEVERLVNEYVPSDEGHLLSKRQRNRSLITSRGMLRRLGLLDASQCTTVGFEGQGGPSTAILRTDFLSRPWEDGNFAVRDSITKRASGNRFEFLSQYSAIYCQLNSLPNEVDSAFLESMFKDAKRSKARYFVLDLRNNQGGNSTWCDAFLRYIVAKPRDLYIYAGWEPTGPMQSRKFSDGVTRISPVTNGLGFQGKLIVLTGPATFSSATFFAVAVKDNELGILVGEPSGNTSIRPGNRAAGISLPVSGIQFSTTNRVWGRALPGVLDREPLYIEPDVLVAPSFADYKAGRDPVFDYLVREIFSKP